TVYIPDDLYKRVYDLCKRLLTLPQPYSNVGLSYASQMKKERHSPGWVFVFADPSVFSESFSKVLQTDIEAQGIFRSPNSMMRCVVQHALQAALGQDCDGAALGDALQ
ncbi:hypothetical protein DNTS_034971, partial [Danionella cerebrum]